MFGSINSLYKFTLLLINTGMSRFLLLCFILLFNVCGVFSQTTYRDQIYKAFINGDINSWVGVMNAMEKEHLDTVDKQLELVSYYYGYTGYLIGKKRNAEAEKYIVKGEKLIGEIIKSAPRNATVYAFKGSFLGFRIGLNKLKALSMGTESIANVDKALELDPQNTQGLIDKANTLYHAPKLFGGDKKEAINYIQKAIKSYELQKTTHNNWLYINTIAQLGRMYENIGDYRSAARMYDKALLVEPNFRWIKNEVYPALKSKIK
ncbi:MAG: tetratricopeptide repeat protein [Bacteroidetes bacterium]|nr:tetratricopeptide repeat protein [Bacteroidota bacterium]